MRKFDIFKIGADMYLVVQAEHLLALNSIILVPVLPADRLPALRKLTVDVEIDGKPHRIRAHMPLTVDAQILKQLKPVHRLSADEGQKVMDGLNAVLWGL